MSFTRPAARVSAANSLRHHATPHAQLNIAEDTTDALELCHLLAVSQQIAAPMEWPARTTLRHPLSSSSLTAASTFADATYTCYTTRQRVSRQLPLRNQHGKRRTDWSTETSHITHGIHNHLHFFIFAFASCKHWNCWIRFTPTVVPVGTLGCRGRRGTEIAPSQLDGRHSPSHERPCGIREKSLRSEALRCVQRVPPVGSPQCRRVFANDTSWSG